MTDETDQALSAPPAVWPVFVAFISAIVGALIGVVVVAIVISIVLVAGYGEPADSIQDRFTREMPFLLAMIVPGQVAFLATALIHARIMKRGIRAALGIRSPNLSPLAWIAIVLGSGVPFALSIGAATLLPSMGGMEGIAEMWSSMSLGGAIVWVFFIGAVPGIVEELLFRGLIQRRLLQRWSPPVAIIVTSILFGLAHVDPPAMAMAFTLGLWLGTLAWRTGSVIPGMVVHATVNSSWNFGQIYVRQAGIDEATLMTVLIPLGVVSLIAYVIALLMLVRMKPVGAAA